MKIFLSLLGLILIALVIAPLLAPPGHGPQRTGPLPWQIEPLPGGNARVFGLTLGVDDLGAARAKLGDDMELAIVARGDERGSLEMFYSRFETGPFTGKLVLSGALDEAAIERMRRHAGKARYLESGARKYRLDPEDLPTALHARIQSLTFVPTVHLDEEIARKRFGPPTEIIRVDATTEHLLYPQQGLDLILNEGHKDVLQYVAPRDFASLRDPLLKYRSQGDSK